MFRLLNGDGGSPSDDAGDADDAARARRIRHLVAKHTEGLSLQGLSGLGRTDKSAVVLTGSTGSLGTYLPSELMERPQVSKIYCLNRSGDARHRQQCSLERDGLHVPVDMDSRVEFLQANLAEASFGLQKSKYDELKTTVDTIIHNAWQVSHKHRLEAFEQRHVAGVRRLVDFSLESRNGAHIHFVSISTVGAWTADRGPLIPETLLDDPSVFGNGYSESKFAGERICALASERSGVPTTSYRVGQVAGRSRGGGMWNKNEWLPSLIATSKVTGQIPSSLGLMPVNWIPVVSLARPLARPLAYPHLPGCACLTTAARWAVQDIAAKTIVEIVESRKESETSSRATVFNLTNPSVAKWETVMAPILARYAMEPVPLEQWCRSLASITDPTETDLRDKPALKLLDLYRCLSADGVAPGPRPQLDIRRAQAASETLRCLAPIDPALMNRWLDQWGF